MKVLDRTELILDIFANRARTYESRLAVELAQLEYSLPRLKRMWTHLSRQKKGIGLRGPGEKQLEDDRRLVERRITDLRDRVGRDPSPQGARSGRAARAHDRLVGRLHKCGQEHALERLTGADVLTEDALFSTLDTRTRRWQLPGWGPVLLSDTVGFIRGLPHHLIASFKATLEEARQADLSCTWPTAIRPCSNRFPPRTGCSRRSGIEEKGHDPGNQQGRCGDRLHVDALLNRYPSAVASRPHRAGIGPAFRGGQRGARVAVSSTSTWRWALKTAG